MRRIELIAVVPFTLAFFVAVGYVVVNLRTPAPASVVTTPGAPYVDVIPTRGVTAPQQESEPRLVWRLTNSNKQLGLPMGVATDSDGNVYIAAMTGGLLKVDSNGKFISTIQPDSAGVFWPAAVAVDAGGNIYAVDMAGYQVWKLSREGKVLTRWGKRGTGPGEFEIAYGIAVSRDGRTVYVADTENARVERFDSNGNLLDMRDAKGSGDAEFLSPAGIALDNAGSMYVTDGKNSRVQIYDPDFKWMTKWTGQGKGSLVSPYGIALDSQNNLFVSDFGGKRVAKFSPGGAVITTWGTEGTGRGQFMKPAGIAVDAAGDIYVADMGNLTVQKFSFK